MVARKSSARPNRRQKTALARRCSLALPDHTHFIFNLHHDHCVIRGIGLSQVAHERGECLRIGARLFELSALSISRLLPSGLAARGKRSWSRLIQSERSWTCCSSSCRTKKNQLSLCSRAPAISPSRVENRTAPRWFDELPVDRRQHRVEVHRDDLRHTVFMYDRRTPRSFPVPSATRNGFPSTRIDWRRAGEPASASMSPAAHSPPAPGSKKQNYRRATRRIRSGLKRWRMGVNLLITEMRAVAILITTE